MLEQRVDKPWGYYIDYYRDGAVVFKKIVIFPGQAISYQVHQQRSEVWYVVAGSGMLRLDDTLSRVADGSTIQVTVGTKHQLTNQSDSAELVLFEMQCGICSEDDIIRISDPYNR